MKNQMFAVRYEDKFNSTISTETIRPQELKDFLHDERQGLIRILEIDQSFDEWETMEVLYIVA